VCRFDFSLNLGLLDHSQARAIIGSIILTVTQEGAGGVVNMAATTDSGSADVADWDDGTVPHTALNTLVAPLVGWLVVFDRYTTVCTKGLRCWLNGQLRYRQPFHDCTGVQLLVQ
jgi:hypothetical protein